MFKTDRKPLNIASGYKGMNEPDQELVQHSWQWENPANFEYSETMNIYFGDLHVHTNYSPCGYQYNYTLEENIAEAKNRGHDIIAVTDHSENMDEGIYSRYFDQLKNYSGKYGIIVIPAIECTSYEHGHRNIYFDSYDVPYMHSTMYEVNNTTKIPVFLEKHGIGGFAIPHHPAAVKHFTNPDSINPEFESLAEMFSTWSSSEYYGAKLQDKTTMHPGSFVQDLLAKGNKLGFTEGGDVHPRYPGDCGLTAVAAPDCSLSSVLSALKKRSCYSLEHDRILMNFSLSGYPMGSIIKINQYNIDKLFPSFQILLYTRYPMRWIDGVVFTDLDGLWL